MGWTHSVGQHFQRGQYFMKTGNVRECPGQRVIIVCLWSMTCSYMGCHYHYCSNFLPLVIESQLMSCRTGQHSHTVAANSLTGCMFFWKDVNNSCTEQTFSLSVSRAEVASSSRRILGFLTSARAIATRCFWPPLNCVPLSPTFVSYFYHKLSSFCLHDSTLSAAISPI